MKIAKHTVALIEYDLTDDDVTALLINANGVKQEWRKMLGAPFNAIRGVLRGQPVGPG